MPVKFFGKIACASALVAGCPICNVLFTELESISLIGDNKSVPTTSVFQSLLIADGYIDGVLASCCVINATPDAIDDGATPAPDVDVNGIELNVVIANRLDSVISFATSGVGIRGRFFCGAPDTTLPLRLSLESVI